MQVLLYASICVPYMLYFVFYNQLKYCSIISSGAMAKDFLLENEVKVNNETENRRGRKIYPGYTVIAAGREIKVEK